MPPTPMHHHPTSTSRPSTRSCTLRPTGSVTLGCAWPKGSPVGTGVGVWVRSCATAVFSVQPRSSGEGFQPVNVTGTTAI